MTKTLVTGGSGFVAGHCVLALLREGHAVRATMRSLSRESEVRSALVAAGMSPDADLEFAAADLTSDDGWAQALDGVGSVLHVASPVAPGHVENEDEIIRPAREGALRVLGAARSAGVGRAVLTSAFHAVGWGHPHDDHVFTEADWTVLDGPGTDAYGRSKTLAERGAWNFVAGGGPELVTLMPVAIMGPTLGGKVSGANNVVKRLLDGAVAAFPNLWFPIVDVRDVAVAHVRALTTPEAGGERFLLGGDPAIPMARIGAILRADLGDAASKVPTASVPDEALIAAAETNPAVAAVVPDLGYARKFSSDKARRVLGWAPRPAEESIVAAGRSVNRS